MATEKRHVAVIGRDELSLGDAEIATSLLGVILAEGWEDHYTVYYGVLPGHTLADVARAMEGFILEAKA